MSLTALSTTMRGFAQPRGLMPSSSPRDVKARLCHLSSGRVRHILIKRSRTLLGRLVFTGPVPGGVLVDQVGVQVVVRAIVGVGDALVNLRPPDRHPLVVLVLLHDVADNRFEDRV